jgi:hypothetical protein
MIRTTNLTRHFGSLAGGQILFWIGIRALWAAGVRRLDQYEEV